MNKIKYYENKNRKRREDSKEKKEELINYFYELENEKIDDSFYTTRVFNSISKYSVKTYCHHFKRSWVNVIKKLGRYENLFLHAIAEYKKFNECMNSQNIHKFIKYNKNFTYDLLAELGLDELRQGIGVTKKINLYTDEDMKNNFWHVYNKFNRIPSYKEFDENTRISINTYASKYKLSGVVYDNIIRMHISDNTEIELYEMKRRELKAETGKRTGYQPGSTKITDEDLEFEFKKTFDHFLNEYGVIPSRRIIEKHLKYDLSNYRRRFKKSWTDICKMYGYEISNCTNRSETIALINVSKVLNTNYIPQKTWDWLIGVGGKNMYCDGYFSEFDLVVEFDGASHRKPIKAFGGEAKHIRLKENDKLKEELLINHGIRILRIDSRTNWDEIDYIKRLLVKNNIVPESKVNL